MPAAAVNGQPWYALGTNPGAGFPGSAQACCLFVYCHLKFLKTPEARLGFLGFLTGNVFIFVTHTFALVWLGWTECPDLCSNLAYFLPIRAPYNNFCLARCLHLNTRR